MGKSGEMFLIMKEEDFNTLNPNVIKLFSNIEKRESNEWEENKNDPNYITLKKAEKKAKKNLQEYLFNKRHK